MKLLQSVGRARDIEDTVAKWPHVSARSHRFGGRGFLFGKAEIGHVHWGRTLDIPFPRSLRDALIADGYTEEHRWVPNSGWTTFHIQREEDLQHALWLLRLSYLRYALKSSPNPREFLKEEASTMHLSPAYYSLLEQFIGVGSKG